MCIKSTIKSCFQKIHEPEAGTNGSCSSLDSASYDDIVTITEGCPLRSKFDRDIVPSVSAARVLGNGSPGALFGDKANPLLVSSCRDTLPTLSQLKLSLQSSFDP